MLADLVLLLESNPQVLTWVGIGSMLMFLGSLLLIPLLVAMIPHDYFAHESRVPSPWKQIHPVFRLVVLVIKNLFGWLILLAGIVMLVLPGQGLLSIFIGLLLMDYPGKYQLERWVVTRPRLLHIINQLRLKRGKPELKF